MKRLICVSLWALPLLPAFALAEPIQGLANLSEVAVYETTFVTTRNAFDPTSSALTTRLSGPLSVGNRDIGYIDDKSYDVYYSNPYGAPDPQGGFLTIEGVWRRPELRPDGGMNINEVELTFGGANPHSQFGDYVASYATGSIIDSNFGVNYIPGSEALAVDHNVSSFPRLGQTSTTDLNDRARITVGFNGISARTTQFKIDPTQSSLTLTADVEGVIPFNEQSPGSLTTALQGTFGADLVGSPNAWTDIRLSPSGQIASIGHPGPFLPTGGAADLAATVDFGDGLLAYVSTRDSTLGLSAGFGAISPGGTFSLDGLLASVTGTLDYDIAGQLTGSRSQTLSALLSGLGTMSQVGDTLNVTIPFDASFVGDANGLTINYRYTGQIVATATVPEPSTFVLAAVGMLGAYGFWIRRRPGRRCSHPALCLVLAAFATATADECRAAPLTVMSFNVRFAADNEVPGSENSWYDLVNPDDARRLKVFDVIKTSAPDIVGLQEPRGHQVADLNGQYNPGEGLLGYDSYAVNRGDGEYTPIFYRDDRFTRVSEGAFWLSSTPNVPGSLYPGATQPRVAIWLILNDRVTGQQYFVLNTHLDATIADARTFGAQVIQSKLQELAGDLPILMTGDFNSSETTPALLALTAPSGADAITLLDPYRQLHPVKTFFESTGSGYTGVTIGSRVDFVLSSAEFTPETASIIRTSYDGKYPSDHYPVLATFDVASVPEPSTFALAGLGIAGLLAVPRRVRSLG